MSGLASLLVAMVIGAAPAPCTYAHDMVTGTRAPCAGVLVPPHVSRECVLLKMSVVPRLRLRVKGDSERHRLELEAAAARLAASSQEADRLRGLLRTVATPPVRPWYEGPAVVAVTSAVLGIAIGAAVAYGVTR